MSLDAPVLNPAPDESPVRAESPDTAARIARASAVWRSAEDPRGTPAETYLGRFGLSLPDELCGRLFRYHRACGFMLRVGGFQPFPSLLALLRDSATDEPRAILKIALSADGKARAEHPQLVRNERCYGGNGNLAVKFTPHAVTQGQLHLCAGLERGLTLYLAGHRSLWCLPRETLFRWFPILPQVQTLSIFADQSNNDGVMEYAANCVDRWRADGREAHVMDPPAIGGRDHG
jgi:hypothetical protein